MGVTDTHVDKQLFLNPVPTGPVDDILRPGDDNPLIARGFVTASFDSLINWEYVDELFGKAG